MAIKLKVQENKAKFKVYGGDSFTFQAVQGIPIYPSDYQGAYEVTPTEAIQTLPTDRKRHV